MDFHFNLLQLFDPTLPIGAYAHSAGLETYTQNGKVKNKKDALVFIKQYLHQNFLYNDAAFFCFAWKFSLEENWDSISTLDQEATALKSAKESREASLKLGSRLIRVAESWNSAFPVLNAYKEKIQAKECLGHVAIVFGILAHELKIPLLEALKAYYYNTASGMVTNCAKLIPIGQQEAQSILFELKEDLEILANQTMALKYEDIGRCAVGFEIRAMQHEKLYSRLYMS